jgi:hypothetical protein
VGKSFYLNIHVDIYNRINTYHNDETLASSIKQNTQQMEKGKTKKEDRSLNQKNKTKSGPQRGK